MRLVALLIGGLLVPAARTTAFQGAEPSATAKAEERMRIVVVDDHGKPVDLTNTLMLGVVDDRGKLTLAKCLKEPKGVAELQPLELGTYWLFVGVPHYDRVVRTISVSAADRTPEQRVELNRTYRERNDAITMESDARGLHSLFDSNASGRIKLALRPTNPNGEELATELVFCAREGGLDGHKEEFPACPITLTLGSRGLGRIQIRASGFAPSSVEVDFSGDSVLDLDPYVLQPAHKVRARLVAPEGTVIGYSWWEYAPCADLELARRYWAQAASSGGAILELGAGPFIVGGGAMIDESRWETPRVVFDPSHDGDELVLPLVQTVPLVLEPTSFQDELELEFLDAAGSLVERKVDFVDVPCRILLIPGTYTLRSRVCRADECRTQTFTLGPTLQRLKLER